MNFQIVHYHGTIEENREITSLLTRVFVEEGYTDKSNAERIFVPAEVRKRGEIMLARSPVQKKLLGMIIFVPSISPTCQVAEADEAEIHLLAVHPETRGQGIASHLIMACEQRAVSFGYSRMILSTQQTMKEAHRVYEQLGYRRNSTRDWSRGTDKTFFVYEKLLQI
ncbi:MAG: GNAT family N-acetyltransferase [Nitrososphaera sp.]|uniref:GNAT family N-acetyltransferase n=1 Tax=Nitrososphaera sp. TaxID=1971748 RepID=UPI003D6E5F11